MPDLLARLMAQAEDEGAGLITIRALAEEAGELAVSRALQRLGLDDGQAQGDFIELRQLLQAWRDAKRAARRAFVGWVVRAMLALLLIGIAIRLGLTTILTDRIGG